MAHLMANDVVPPLRHNLVFKDLPEGLGGGFLTVQNFETGEETFLRGFEYSLARMLDGKRTAKEVVAAAGDVGLPVSLDDLDAFVKKMSLRHLVGREAEAIATSPFESRERWDPQTRELFRLALRKGRGGDLEQAVSALNVLLQETPMVVEAHNLRHRLKEQMRAGESQLPFHTVFAQTERNWRFGEMGTEPELEAQVEPRAIPTLGRSALLIAAGAALAVALVALIAMVIPFPRKVKVNAALVPVATERVAAPRSGLVNSVPVQIDHWVERDAVLITYDADEELTQLAAALGRLDGLERRLQASLPPTPRTREARDAYQQADVELAVTRGELENARGEGRTIQLEAAEASVDRALSALSAAHQAMNSNLPAAELEELEAQQAEVRALQRQVQEAEVRAPQAGVVTALEVLPGQEVERGANVAQLDDTRKLKAIATVTADDARALAPGLKVLVLSQDRATSAEVTRIEGLQVEVLVDNTARNFEPSLAQLQIRGKAVPLVP